MKALYGLPEKVTFCTKCVLSNQRPNSSVEFKHDRARSGGAYTNVTNGICAACRVAEEKDRIDWTARKKYLEKLLEKYRGTGSSYDCIVPGSGGKDSFYTAHILKHEFGMNPLLVTWQPIKYTTYGLEAYFKWCEEVGADSFSYKPNPDVMVKLTRLGFDRLLHPFQTFILGQKNLAAKIAVERGIELIFYGESPAEYGNGVTEFEQAAMNSDYYSVDSYDDIKLGGVGLKSLISNQGFTMSQLKPFLPLLKSELSTTGLQYLYLSHFLKWDPQANYYYAVKHGDFSPRPHRSEGTYTRYSSFDDKIDDLHYYTTYVKYGIGRATYDASQEIRNGHITRSDGVNLVRKFDGQLPARYLDSILDLLGLSFVEFSKKCNEFRSPHLWDLTNPEEPLLKYGVWH